MRGMMIGCFTSQRWYYAPLKHLLRRDGLNVEVLDPGPLGLNVWSLETFLSYAEPQVKDADYLIGHSLGGIQATLLMALNPRIQRVVTIGSPVWGTPITLYQQAILRMLDVEPWVVHLFQHHLMMPFAHRISTLASTDDTIAPPAACAIPGARNFTIRGDHLTIPYQAQARSIIRAELAHVQS